METTYNVYFAGRLLPGQEIAGVRARLGRLFNADQATLDKLFSGRTQLLKRNCDKATAARYKRAMEKAGALPVIKACTPHEPAHAAPRPASAAEKIAALAAAPDKTAYRSSHEVREPQPLAGSERDGLYVAPVGSDVLRPHERTTPPSAEIDTSALVLDESAQRLSDEPPPPPPAPDTSHLALGAAGEDIPGIGPTRAPLSPDLSGLDLSPPGTDFSDCRPPPATAPALDLTALELAEPGSDVLEQKYRTREQVRAPATDHIALSDRGGAG
ncbi:MAG: hypothetical protein KDI16_16390 [Halioglobus sp.]|nr:hypothetical protein [Halioglobus sp.]